MGIALCLLAFVAALLACWRSVAAGLGVVLTAGYLFGILRANYPDTFSHFIFDAAVLGFFCSYLGRGGLTGMLTANQQILQRWTFVLLGWACLVFLLPMQHPMIQLVGLRGNGFLLPFLLVGSRMTREEAVAVALWLCVLNHVAFGFAMAEYVLGVPAFYPENPVTELIYRSRDVAGYTAFRIPATFANAHAYGGTMAISIPWLLGAWVQPRMVDWQRGVLASSIAVAMIGAFLCAARLPLILVGVLVLVATVSGQLRGTIWIAWTLLILGVAYLVSSEERMQRFLSLQDADQVAQRIEGSVNMSLLDLFVTYPFGNGLGAGGTSIPFFLQHLLQAPVVVENEYARILLEQGVTGLVLWVVFIVWILCRKPIDRRDPWLFGKHLMWVFTAMNFAVAILGTGLMTAIPHSMLFFLGAGFLVAPPLLVRSSKAAKKRGEVKAEPAATQLSVA